MIHLIKSHVLTFAVNKDVAIKAIPEEDNVVLVSEVNVSSCKEVWVKAGIIITEKKGLKKYMLQKLLSYA